MSRPERLITIRLDHGLIEHPRALHIRRMRAAVWLYLELLARLPDQGTTVEADPASLASAMGVPAGTIRSWLGHLRKHRYVRIEGNGPVLRLRIRHLPANSETATAPKRFFTVGKLFRALGEPGNRQALDAALEDHGDEAIKRALAGALAVPQSEIRRSRTALFLYLLKTHAKPSEQHDPGP